MHSELLEDTVEKPPPHSKSKKNKLKITYKHIRYRKNF